MLGTSPSINVLPSGMVTWIRIRSPIAGAERAALLLWSVRVRRLVRSVKLTVTVMLTGTATPFISVGVYCHCLTASIAA